MWREGSDRSERAMNFLRAMVTMRTWTQTSLRERLPLTDDLTKQSSSERCFDDRK
jgi:hypothetical protein